MDVLRAFRATCKKAGIDEHAKREADLFAVYSPETKEAYVLAVDECPVTDVWLRLTPTRNGQQLRIRWAEEHAQAAWVARQASSPANVAAGRSNRGGLRV